ncbi:hypothetical protein DXX93_08175 [Thalassotalea euphylliae]|uniref:Uncharacterized protein n=1 Tax=Thalassotalea euphylliae TaxID=1655234 RepID=A0A3E0TPY3_9GAMM|nr:hypothetical protein [Thalassotalea euphylliae]REL26558.1 hypothetical protein DXX93_08175 [Thalassotalea euphylliae]
MLGKLKAAAGDAATNKAASMLAPHINPVIEKMQQLSPKAIAHDASYTEKIIEPAMTTITAAAGGLTKLLPNFDEKFNACMFHLRNELLDLSGETVGLTPNFTERLPQVLAEGLKQ